MRQWEALNGWADVELGMLGLPSCTGTYGALLSRKNKEGEWTFHLWDNDPPMLFKAFPLCTKDLETAKSLALLFDIP